MANPYQQVGIRIRFFREKQGLTQSQLAEKTELSDNHIGLIERGERQAPLHTLDRIAKVLELELWELFKPINSAGEAESLQQIKRFLNKKEFRDAKLLLAIYKSIRECSQST